MEAAHHELRHLMKRLSCVYCFKNKTRLTLTLYIDIACGSRKVNLQSSRTIAQYSHKDLATIFSAEYLNCLCL